MTTISATDRAKGISLLLVSGFCWGFHGVLIKFAYGMGASFVQLFFFETLIGSLIFACFAKRFGTDATPKTSRDWALLSLAGLSTLGIGCFLFLSFALGPIAIGATLLFLYVPQVYCYSVFTKKERLSLYKTVSILLLLTGAALTTDILNVFSDGKHSGAILAGIAASLCYTVLFILTPVLERSTSAIFRSFALSLCGTIGTGIILFAIPSYRQHIETSWLVFGALILVLGIIGQTLPVFTMMKGIPLTGSSLASVLASSELPVAVISSALILGEPITIGSGTGVALVLLGILIFNFDKSE